MWWLKPAAAQREWPAPRLSPWWFPLRVHSLRTRCFYTSRSPAHLFPPYLFKGQTLISQSSWQENKHIAEYTHTSTQIEKRPCDLRSIYWLITLFIYLFLFLICHYPTKSGRETPAVYYRLIIGFSLISTLCPNVANTMREEEKETRWRAKERRNANVSETQECAHRAVVELLHSGGSSARSACRSFVQAATGGVRTKVRSSEWTRSLVLNCLLVLDLVAL